MTKISVIIPVYNCGNSIKRCLRSISRQTFLDYELIIVDDGSTDNSYEIINQYIKEDYILRDKTRLYRQNNAGVAETRNYGIKLAESEYIAFIDQDDFISSNYLENYHNAAIGYDIVIGGYERVARDGRILFQVVPKPSDWAGYLIVSPWAHLYRRQFIISNNIEFLDNNIGEDIYFNIVALNSSARVKTIVDRGYKWFYNEHSVSNSSQNIINKDTDTIKLLDAIYGKILGDNSGKYSKYLEYFCLRYVCWYILFSTRGSRKTDIEDAYNRHIEWISIHFPNYRRCKYVGFSKPVGESAKFHAYVVGFYLAERLGILKPLLRLFGK